MNIDAQTSIRAIIDEWYAALNRGDAHSAGKHYAHDVLVASLAPPLWTRGNEKYIANMTGWFSTFCEPLKGEPEKVEIIAGDTLAFVNGYSHLRGQKKGEDSEREWRVRLTLCFEKRGDRWLVVADHTSVPFDMSTLRPLMTLSE